VEKFDFNKCFNTSMSSDEALHIYVKLLKTVPENLREDLGKAYDAVYLPILKRECENVKKYGMMY